MLAAAMVRHLQTDQLLPGALLPPRWPGTRLRDAYGNDYAAYRQSGVPFYLPVPGRDRRGPADVTAALPAAGESLQGSV